MERLGVRKIEGHGAIAGRPLIVGDASDQCERVRSLEVEKTVLLQPRFERTLR